MQSQSKRLKADWQLATAEEFLLRSAQCVTAQRA